MASLTSVFADVIICSGTARGQRCPKSRLPSVHYPYGLSLSSSLIAPLRQSRLPRGTLLPLSRLPSVESKVRREFLRFPPSSYPSSASSPPPSPASPSQLSSPSPPRETLPSYPSPFLKLLPAFAIPNIADTSDSRPPISPISKAGFLILERSLSHISAMAVVTAVTLLTLGLLSSLPSPAMAMETRSLSTLNSVSAMDSGGPVLFLSDSDVLQEAPAVVVVDSARMLTEARLTSLSQQIRSLEGETGWRLRVLTRGVGNAGPAGNELRELWHPDENTIIVIEDLSSPNVLNFNTGDRVRTKLPRQFFLELQSRYGNQFFVAEEGEFQVLSKTVGAITECLEKTDGCTKVPGLVDELYFLTLTTSIVGGTVFGFAARTPPSGRIESSWQWILIFSPLWGILFLSFGVLPVTTRTDDLVPLIKNFVGFLGGATAIYLTPILGQSPISNVSSNKNSDNDESQE